MAEHVHRWQLSTGVTPVTGDCECGAHRTFDNRVLSAKTMPHFGKPKAWQQPKAKINPGYWA